jgi:Bacterial protein of unknown function (DUF922)
MRKIFVGFSLTILLSACSPKLGTHISKPQPALSPYEPVLVFDKTESNNDGIYIGTVKAGDNGFSTHCNYEEVIAELKRLARQNGANVLRITEDKKPDNISSCERIKAEIFRVVDFKKYEKAIEWSNNRKLVWDDFKGVPDTVSKENVGAETHCGVIFSSYYPSLFGKPKFYVKNIFNCDSSWVKPDQKYRQDLLQHEQTHFDLCEVYTRLLRKELAEAKIPPQEFELQPKHIFKTVYQSYWDRQQQYDKETNHGLDHIKQSEWSAKIQNELEELSQYGE